MGTQVGAGEEMVGLSRSPRSGEEEHPAGEGSAALSRGKKSRGGPWEVGKG